MPRLIISGAIGAVLLSCAHPSQHQLQPSHGRDWGPEIQQALHEYYPQLFRGAALEHDAHGIWFIADPAGQVLGHGLRDSLPEAVAFNAIPAIVPELNGRPHQLFELTYADSIPPGVSVAVLWVVLRK